MSGRTTNVAAVEKQKKMKDMNIVSIVLKALLVRVVEILVLAAVIQSVVVQGDFITVVVNVD
jgi:hypothetical protein